MNSADWIRGPNWQADCPQCVGSKFTCDEHFAPAQQTCDLGPMHGRASTHVNQAGVECCDFCGQPIAEDK